MGKKSQAKENHHHEGEKISKMSTLSKLCYVAVELILLGVAGLIIFRTINDVGLVLYTFHPVLMSIGYLLLLSNTILVIANNNLLTHSLNYQNRVTAHWMTSALGLILITIAQAAIYINKDNNGYPHYQSYHSYFGLVTYLLTFIVGTVSGTAAKYSYKLKKFKQPAEIKIGHATFACIVYVLAVTTIYLGLNQSWVKLEDEGIKFGLLVLLVITTGYVVSKSIVEILSKKKELSKKIKT